MAALPFSEEDVRVVRAELVTGAVLLRVQEEFTRTNAWWYAFEFMLDDWKEGRLRMAGVMETPQVFDHAHAHGDWHMQNFAKPGAPWSIFFGGMLVSEDGIPQFGWISPSVDRRCVPWIRRALDPTNVCKHWGGVDL